MESCYTQNYDLHNCEVISRCYSFSSRFYLVFTYLWTITILVHKHPEVRDCAHNCSETYPWHPAQYLVHSGYTMNSVPWAARRSNQSILKEISPEFSLEGLMLKLKLQYFSHLMRRTNSLEKTLMMGKIKGGRRRVNDRG